MMVKNVNELNDDCLGMILELLSLKELFLIGSVCKKWLWLQNEICLRKQYLFLSISSKGSVKHRIGHRYIFPINMYGKQHSYCHDCALAIKQINNNNILVVRFEFIKPFSSYINSKFPNLKFFMLHYAYCEIEPLCELLKQITPENGLCPIKCLILLLPSYSDHKKKLDWTRLSRCISENYKQLKHFATSGCITNISDAKSCNWTFLKKIEHLNLTNTPYLSNPLGVINKRICLLEKMNPNLKTISINFNPSFFLNAFHSLTFLELYFSDFAKMFSEETISKLDEMSSLREWRLHNYDSLRPTHNLKSFYDFPKICRQRMIKFKFIQSLTLDFFFDSTFLPKLLESLFPNLTNLNVTFFKLDSYDLLDFIDSRFQSFAVWVVGIYDQKQLQVSINKSEKNSDNNNNNNVLHFDFTDCAYCWIENYYNYACRFISKKGKTIVITLNKEQKKRLCKTLATRIKQKRLPLQHFNSTCFIEVSDTRLAMSRCFLEATSCFGVPSYVTTRNLHRLT